MNSRTILCRHKDYAHQNIEVDFRELWEGAPNENLNSATNNWGGGFRGRPQLADQIIPTLRVLTHKDLPKNISSRLSAFRGFFRFLDSYEGWAESQGPNTFPASIDRLEAITTHHLQLWKTPSPGGEWHQADWNKYRIVTQCLRNAVDRHGMPKLIVPSYSRSFNIDQKNNPGERVGKFIVKMLAKEANAIYADWERADRLAATGRNLLGIERTAHKNNRRSTIRIEGGVNEADLHATYRAAVAVNNGVTLNRLQFLAIFGYGDGESIHTSPVWWPRYEHGHKAGNPVQFFDLPSGLYPSAEQVAVLFLLFLARTGWNPSTAESLDITDEVNWCKDYTEKYVWLFAYKPRSRNWQDTVAIKNHRTGAYQIITRLQERTAALRRAIERDPSVCTNHKIGKRSPWLYQRNNEIRVEVSETHTVRVLRNLINSHNAHEPSEDRQIPTMLSATDLRDIFAVATFVNSNFSLFVTQLALGHKRSITTFNYLRRRAWRAESEQKKNALFVALINQIETHQVIDLTLLRAKMDGITVTQEMIDRLDTYRRYRTYVGAGCSDPKHPPAFIDPTNPRDGTMSCAQGHLCAGCPKGRIFNDSLPYLARRQAELEWLRDTLPLEVFQDSSLADQLLVLQTTLKQWATDVVAKHVAHWSARIIAGTHQPIRFSGEH